MPARAVDGHGVEGERVARLHVPGEDVVAAGVDVGHRLVVLAALVFRAALREGLRLEPALPTVRAGDEGERAALARHGVERQPEGHDRPAAHRPVGLVVVPARRLRRARLLHEQLVVEEVEPLGVQEPRRHRPERSFAAEGAEALMRLPDAQIAVEAPGFRPVAVEIGPRLRDVALDRVREHAEPCRRHDTFHQHRAVAVEIRLFPCRRGAWSSSLRGRYRAPEVIPPFADRNRRAGASGERGRRDAAGKAPACLRSAVAAIVAAAAPTPPYAMFAARSAAADANGGRDGGFCGLRKPRRGRAGRARRKRRDDAGGASGSGNRAGRGAQRRGQRRHRPALRPWPAGHRRGPARRAAPGRALSAEGPERLARRLPDHAGLQILRGRRPRRRTASS